ncbi:hypothetical protein MRX96_052192, partial [Rhipicephalus microplus]
MTGTGARAVAERKILTLLLPRVGNNPSGDFILLPGDFFSEDHLLERHPRSVSLGRPSGAPAWHRAGNVLKIEKIIRDVTIKESDTHV